MSNKTFHGLKLLSLCGGGAFGEVWYCEDISGRRLAVKIVSKQKIGDQWERELRGVVNYRRITENAPELLQIYHVEEDENSFFYTMEPADSVCEDSYQPDTLARRLQDGPLPQEQIFTVLAGIFAGIKTIHAAGFTHRDIKPDNILFVKGVPKLGDIGLMSSISATMTQIAGTLDFLPPEIKADGTPASDRESRQKNDLYAFGKVIYCVITGESPHNWPAVPSKMPLTLPLKFFLRLSFHLCEKDQAYRLNSIAALEKEFDEIKRKLLYGETVRDKIKYSLKVFKNNLRGGMYNLWCWSKKHWVIALAAILCCAGAVYWLKPEEPYDITARKSKLYEHQPSGLTMSIDPRWESLGDYLETQYKDVSESGLFNDKKQALEEIYKEAKKQNADMIFCDFEPVFQDNITITSLPPGEPGDFTEKEFTIMLKEYYSSMFGVIPDVYEIKKISINGIPCFSAAASYKLNSRDFRQLYYLMRHDGHQITIVLTAKQETFAKRKEEFESVIRTVKIKKSTPSAVRK